MLKHREDPLPDFRSAAELPRAIAAAMRPPARITVSEAAERHRRLSNPGAYTGPWRNDMAPYMVEPMNRAIARDVDMSVWVGPTQFGKSEGFLNIIAHGIKYRPGDALVFQPTQGLALDFAERRIENKMLDISPDLGAEIGPDRSDDKRLTKTFRNGMMVSVAWPVTGQLSSRPVPTVLIDERDSMADDIGGEGDPVMLGRKRNETFGKNAVTVVASSPKREDYTGIVPLYDAGECNLFHWRCPECGEHFAPGFDANRKPTLDHLHIPQGADAETARAAARLICPHCGSLIEERFKFELNKSGVWLAKGQTIDREGRIAGARPRNRIASYWFHGLFVNTKRWGEIAAELVAARREFERTQDETKLKTFHQTTLGVTYKSAASVAASIDPDDLRARASGLSLGIVPAWVAMITCAVDVQGNRFDVKTVGWGRGGEAAVVDLFQIFKTVDESGQERLLDPAHRPEDWNLLFDQVLAKEYPVEGAGGAVMRPLKVALDSGGGAGVTGQAYEFMLRARKHAVHKRLMLIKGRGDRTLLNRAAPLVSVSMIETDLRGKRLKKGIRLHTLNVNALKDMAAARLGEKSPGPRYLHIPTDIPDRWFDEVTAEGRNAGGTWEKLRARNESWDLLVYNIAAFIQIGGFRINWDNPPAYARALVAPPPSETPNAVRPEASEVKPAAEKSVAAKPARKIKPWMLPRRGGGFVSRFRG